MAGAANGMVLSELLLLVVLSLVVRAATGVGAASGHPLARVGSLGRAYLAFVVVAVATDAMTLGGWWAVAVFAADRGWLVTALVVGRFALWVSSAAVICHVLEVSGELERQGGVWSHTLGWSVAEPYASLGRVLVRKAPRGPAAGRPSSTTASSTTNPSVSSATTTSSVPKPSSSQGAGDKVSGRSSSNLAGKSRLVV